VLLPLVDSLRCPREHDPSSLVLSAEEWSGTRVRSGVLGCPVCHARFPIAEGIVDFSNGIASLAAEPLRGSEPDGLRLAAQLGLTEPGGIILLTGTYAAYVDQLLDLAEFTPILTDAVAGSAVTLRVLDRLPLTDGALRAAAIDAARATHPFLVEVSRAVRSGGRVVAPAGAPVPATIRVLARDDREWLGEVESTAPMISLRRGSR
jgi:uncharacterized protein YbaR (Trm112 family)